MLHAKESNLMEKELEFASNGFAKVEPCGMPSDSRDYLRGLQLWDNDIVMIESNCNRDTQKCG